MESGVDAGLETVGEIFSLWTTESTPWDGKKQRLGEPRPDWKGARIGAGYQN